MELEGSSVFKPDLESLAGVGKGNSLEYSCLENPMDGGAW